MVHSSVWIPLLFLQTAFGLDGGGGGSDGGGGGGGVSTTLTATSNITVTLSPSTTSTPASSSTKPAITPSTTSIYFAIPSNATTCAPITFYWHVAPSATANSTDSVNVRLLITNNEVQQQQPNSSVSIASSQHPSSPNIPITRPITNNTALTSDTFHWSAVTVPSGWYKLDVLLPSSQYFNQAIAQSAPFFVMTGSNTSCVFPNNSTLAAQSHSRLGPGALAGTVVGSVVGAAALLGAFALPRLWRRGVPGHQAWKDNRGGLYRVF